MATIGYTGALGGMAKDAVKGAGNALVGGLKGAVLREMPGVTAGYAFGKELNKRAGTTKMSSSGTPPSINQQASTSSAMGGFGASVSIVAGQNKSNIINLEQVRQLKQLNNSVITQSKLIAFQIADQKRKDQFAEEAANEQAFRDDKLLEAIQKLGGGSGSGKKGSATAADGGEGIGSGIANALSSFAGSLAGTLGRSLGPILMTGLRALISPIGLAITAAVTAAFAAYKFFGSDSKPTPPKAPKPPPSPAAKAEMSDILKQRAELEKQLKNAPFEKQPAIRKKIREHDEKYKDVRENGPSPVTRETYFERMGKAESGAQGNNAKNKDSTATGKYQFLAGTWQETVTEMASKGAIRREDYIGLENRADPEKARKVAEYFTEKNRAVLKVTLGREPTETDLYMAHFLGTSGGPEFLKMLSKNPNALGIDAASKKAVESNRNIFYDAGGKPRTVGEIYALMSQKLGGNNSRVASALPKDVQAKAEAEAKKNVGKKPQPPSVVIDNSESDNYYKGLGVDGTGKGRTNNVGIVPIVAKGGGDGGGLVPTSAAGGGTKIEDNKPIPVFDKKADEDRKNEAKAQGINNRNGTLIPSKAASYGTALQTKVFKPLFKNNSDIIAETNKTFLQQFRQTATNAFTQAITKGLFPNGFGVSAAAAGRDDTFRGQQLQKIFGTDKVISDATTKLLGKQYGPMFAPLFNNLAQGYLEVGSRVAGKAIFQGIGNLGAQETQTITGQVLGNFAAGNKKLALEQLLYGASGGSKGGIALGPETLLAKYGFANPMEGISYFASALGERATQPFAKMMGADDRNKSVIYDPRTKQYVYADTGAPASQADITASGNYGSPVSQSTVFSPGMNNYGMPGAPYQTTAGVDGTYRFNTGPVYRKVVDPNTGMMVAPTQAQLIGKTDQEFARNVKENTLLAEAQLAVMKENAQKDAERTAAAMRADGERSAKALEAQGKSDEAAQALSKAETSANDYVTKYGAESIVVAVKEAAGKGSGSGTQVLDKDGNPVNRRPGQLFDSNVYKDGKIVGSDPMKEIGNFAFDMGKNYLGQQLTKDIKNPYMQMVANFAIQKGLNWGVEQLFGKGDATGIISPIIDQAGSWLSDAGSSIMSFFGFADGGPVTGPGTGRSDSIPAMLSNGEFVVNAGATKKYRPLLDALNLTKYADGTSSTPGSVKALSTALGTDKQISALGDQTTLLTSIDNSLLRLSGGGTGSGTSVSSYGGTAFDVGLGSPYGGSVSSGRSGATVMNGVARSSATQQKPSTMDYVSAIGGSMLKSFAINQAIGMASTAVFGATPMALLGNAYGGLQLGMAGFTPATFVGPLAPGALTGMEIGASFAGGSSAAAGTAVAAEGLGGAAVAAETGGLAAAGSSLAAAVPYIAAAVAIYMIFDSYGGGGGGGPPPKEPKFHAAIYVAGNNNISAIAPIYETTDYHAVPEVFKTIAYGLLKVAFNATKTSEKITNTNAPYDWVYMKVQFDRVSMLWGKGAPNPATLIDDNATEVKRWPALVESTNLNVYAGDILDLVRDEFKKSAKAEHLGKLDQAAEALGGYSLHSLSSGLVSDLKSGNYKLDTSIEKGIYADNVAESQRIGDLITAANRNKAYTTEATEAEYGFDPEDTDLRNGAKRVITKEATAGGVPMVWSVKDGKFIQNAYPGALILDAGGRPVYDIEGTSAGLTTADFVSGTVAGANRPANVLLPPPTPTGSGGTGSTNNTVVGGAKIDNSSVTNFYNSLSTVTDVVRSTTNQVGVVG